VASQEFEGDAFMARCQATNPADSCAEKLGPDYDFGGSSAILQTVGGKDILLAAGKGGVAIALDPDNEGKLLWRIQCGKIRPRQPPVWRFGAARRMESACTILCSSPAVD